jgi:O-antigen/teichoic acid export membrane protein
MIQLLYGNNYLHAIPVFRLFLIYGVFATLPLFQRPVYYVHNKSSYYLYYTVIVGLINIILLYVFVQLYGLLGVAYALILSCVVALSLAVYLSNKLGSQIRFRNILIPMFVAIPLTVIIYFSIYRINAWFAATLFSVCYIFVLKTIGYLTLPPIKTVINEIALGRKKNDVVNIK